MQLLCQATLTSESATKLASMDIDMLSKIKVEELKTFLRLRGLKVSGKKQELVARVFIAIEHGKEVRPRSGETVICRLR